MVDTTPGELPSSDAWTKFQNAVKMNSESGVGVNSRENASNVRTFQKLYDNAVHYLRCLEDHGEIISFFLNHQQGIIRHLELHPRNSSGVKYLRNLTERDLDRMVQTDGYNDEACALYHALFPHLKLKVSEQQEDKVSQQPEDPDQLSYIAFPKSSSCRVHLRFLEHIMNHGILSQTLDRVDLSGVTIQSRSFTYCDNNLAHVMFALCQLLQQHGVARIQCYICPAYEEDVTLCKSQADSPTSVQWLLPNMENIRIDQCFLPDKAFYHLQAEKQANRQSVWAPNLDQWYSKDMRISKEDLNVLPFSCDDGVSPEPEPISASSIAQLSWWSEAPQDAEGHLDASQKKVEAMWDSTKLQAQLGTKGDGVRIGIVDTGACAYHDVLQAKRIEYRSFGVSGHAFVDDNGHGTHCVGNIIDLAPEAEYYVAAAIRPDGTGSLEDINIG